MAVFRIVTRIRRIERFGEYYPSIAVLAGYLEKHGISVRQFDLNNLVAEIVSAASDVVFENPVPENAYLAAVQVLERQRRVDPFLTDLRSRDRISWLRPLDALSSPFQIEATISEAIAVLNESDERVPWYEKLFCSSELNGGQLSETRLVGISVARAAQGNRTTAAAQARGGGSCKERSCEERLKGAPKRLKQSTRTSLPSSLRIAWNGVLKPRHFLGVRLAVRTMSWI